MKTSLSPDFDFDLKTLLETRLLIQANSGGGKSWLIRKLLEETHGKVQHIVLDLEGEFSTLREKYDYILAGKGGDTPASPQSAALLARKLLELNVSAIIDLYELPAHERKSFVRYFLESMINAPKESWHHVLVVIDEAHVFAPEKGESEAAGAVIDLCTRGRKRGFCAVLATQRLSKLNKDAAAECNNKLIGRAGLDVDMKRASEELGFTSKEQTMTLRNLDPGEFYAFGPALSRGVVKIQIGTVKTSHPKVGGRVLTHTVPPTEAIKRVLAKLSDLPDQAKKEAQTIDDLIRKNRELERELRNQKTVDKIVEKPVLPPGLENAMQGLVNRATAIAEDSSKLEDDCRELLIKLRSSKSDTGNPVSHAPKVPVQNTKFRAPHAAPAGNNGDLTGPEKRILNAIAWFESIGIYQPDQAAVAFLAGYTIGGGAFNNPRSKLRSSGLIEYSGNAMQLTDAGRLAAEKPNGTLTTDELHAKVLSILPGPEQRLLKPLLEFYPGALTNEELAAQAGYEPNGGAFNNPRSRLRSMGLIEYLPDRTLKAKSILFL
jgi:hypothetical protein